MRLVAHQQFNRFQPQPTNVAKFDAYHVLCTSQHICKIILFFLFFKNKSFSRYLLVWFNSNKVGRH